METKKLNLKEDQIWISEDEGVVSIHFGGSHWKFFYNEAADLQKYKTACEAINPENPLAVAENLWNVIECVKLMSEGTIDEIRQYRREANKVLTKIQAKP